MSAVTRSQSNARLATAHEHDSVPQQPHFVTGGKTLDVAANFGGTCGRYALAVQGKQHFRSLWGCGHAHGVAVQQIRDRPFVVFGGGLLPEAQEAAELAQRKSQALAKIAYLVFGDEAVGLAVCGVCGVDVAALNAGVGYHLAAVGAYGHRGGVGHIFALDGQGFAPFDELGGYGLVAFDAICLDGSGHLIAPPFRCRASPTALSRVRRPSLSRASSTAFHRNASG